MWRPYVLRLPCAQPHPAAQPQDTSGGGQKRSFVERSNCLKSSLRPWEKQVSGKKRLFFFSSHLKGKQTGFLLSTPLLAISVQLWIYYQGCSTKPTGTLRNKPCSSFVFIITSNKKRSWILWNIVKKTFAFLHCFKKNQVFFPHVLPSVHWCICSLSHTLKLSKQFSLKKQNKKQYSLKSEGKISAALPSYLNSQLINECEFCWHMSPVLCPLSNLHCICMLTHKGGLLFQPLYTSCKVADLLEVSVSFAQWNTGTLAGQLLLFCFLRKQYFWLFSYSSD